MDLFQAKISWKRMRKRENKNYLSVPFLPNTSQKIEKKLKKNTIMPLFLAKIGWKRMRKRANKNYNSVPFLPDAQQKIPKKQQKN